jgi:hypothetical protein
LNTCFISLIDALTVSERLKQDTKVMDELRRAIQTFLMGARSSRVHNESLEANTFEGVHKGSQIVPNLEQAPQVLLSQIHSATDRTARNISTTNGMISRRPSPKLTKISRAVASTTETGPDKYNPSATQIGPSEFYRNQINQSIFQSASWQYHEANDHRFASRLQREAFKAGYNIIRKSEKNFTDFRQVFSSILQFRTCSDLFSFFAKVLMENFERLLEPPGISQSTFERPDEVELDGSWLNATEVSQYFREKGLDFDSSPSFAELEIDAEHSDMNSTSGFTTASTFPVTDISAQSLDSLQTLGFSTPWTYLPTFNNVDFATPRAPCVHIKRKVAIDVTKLIKGE